MPVVGKGDWAGTHSKKEQISQHCAGWGAASQEELKGGRKLTPTQKYPPKKSNLLVPVLEGGLHGAATCSPLGQNLLVPVLEGGLRGAATRSTPGQGPKRCPQPCVPPGHPNRGTTRSASPGDPLPAGPWEGAGGGYGPVPVPQLSVPTPSRSKRSPDRVIPGRQHCLVEQGRSGPGSPVLPAASRLRLLARSWARLLSREGGEEATHRPWGE